MVVYACLTPWKRKQSSTILMFFWVLCTDPSSNKCVWHLWVADNPNLLESFHFKFSLMEFSCKHQKTSSQFSLPHMSVSIWKNRCVQDVSCPPWKWVGVGLHPTDHGLVCRGRGGCWSPRCRAWWSRPAPRSCCRRHLPLPSLSSVSLLYTHHSVNKVCALFCWQTPPCHVSLLPCTF